MSAFGSGGGGGRLNPIWRCVEDEDEDFESDFDCCCDCVGVGGVKKAALEQGIFGIIVLDIE